MKVEVASLQALLSGGVAFDTPAPSQGKSDVAARQMAEGSEFELYRTVQDAVAAGYTTRQAFVAYFESSVRGLARGSAVEFFGLQIGAVTDVQLDFDEQSLRSRVRVTFEIQPERVQNIVTKESPVDVARRLVERGLRVQMATGSFITGSQILSLVFVPNAPKAELVMDGDMPILPTTGGGLDNILAAAGNIAAKLDRLPLDEIGANLNATLRSASGALGSVEGLAKRADAGLSPVLQRLPAIIASLQDAVAKAGRTFGALETGYGKDSQFSRELDRAMAQVGDTARSIRLLADYLNRHPEALVRGRADYGVTR